MNQDRIALVALAMACTVGMAACNRTHTPTDAELTQLLHVERATAADLQAPLDPAAINCLRAWSGDIELTATLPPITVGEAAKKMCRQRLDGWIADAARNPDKMKFEEVSAPPAVRRAVALQTERRGMANAPMPSMKDNPPPGLMAPNGAPNAAPSAPVDMTATLAAVGELDGYCQKAKQAAANGETTQPIARYASFCDKRVAQLHMRIAAIQQNGNAQQAQMISTNVQRTLEMARQMESQPATPAAPAPAKSQ
ncbi:MAG TPA: hypothetical protein VGO25_07005 [Rhodanobacteraceae bacterium]|jgi:hypothetical protein|nr:hypothetical protein [Rhodanobacteraceae bacterium]